MTPASSGRRKCKPICASISIYDTDYDQHYRRLLFGDTQPERDFILEQVRRGEHLFRSQQGHLPERWRLLDVGCSAGGLMVAFAKRGWEVLGTDPDGAYADYGRNRLGLDVRAMPAEDMELPPAHFASSSSPARWSTSTTSIACWPCAAAPARRVRAGPCLRAAGAGGPVAGNRRRPPGWPGRAAPRTGRPTGGCLSAGAGCDLSPALGQASTSRFKTDLRVFEPRAGSGEVRHTVYDPASDLSYFMGAGELAAARLFNGRRSLNDIAGHLAREHRKSVIPEKLRQFERKLLQLGLLEDPSAPSATRRLLDPAMGISYGPFKAWLIGGPRGHGRGGGPACLLRHRRGLPAQGLCGRGRGHRRVRVTARPTGRGPPSFPTSSSVPGP